MVSEQQNNENANTTQSSSQATSQPGSQMNNPLRRYFSDLRNGLGPGSVRVNLTGSHRPERTENYESYIIYVAYIIDPAVSPYRVESMSQAETDDVNTPSGEQRAEAHAHRSLHFNIDFIFFTENDTRYDFIKKSKLRRKIRAALKQDKPYIFEGSEKKNCCICLSDYKKKQRIRKLECGHDFHMKCVDSWLMGGEAVCPVCRHEYAYDRKCKAKTRETGR
ncbi:hypothetical protein PAEPH01_2376 [Pancytospora epiphaga]|nr:hypothetical protein PAEPH01_2376 [Pancytospora epiphaga]